MKSIVMLIAVIVNVNVYSQVFNTKADYEKAENERNFRKHLGIYEMRAYKIDNYSGATDKTQYTISKYNENGLKIENLFVVPNEHKGKITYTYNKENLVETENYLYEANNYKSNEITSYYYINEWMLNKTIKSEGTTTDYKYDTNNRLIKQGDYTNIYDNDGNLLKSSSDKYSTSYIYDNNKNLINSKWESGSYNTETKYKYDINNKLIYKKEQQNIGELNSYECSYEYNQDATVSKETYYNVIGSRFIKLYWSKKYEYLKHSNAEIISSKVQIKIDDWQKKGKYETTQEFTQRVTEDNRNKQAQLYTQEVINEIGHGYSIKPISMDYDADNETFKILFKELSPIYVKVPRVEAETFDNEKDNLQMSNQQFTLSNDKLILLSCKINIPSNNKEYIYDSKQDIAFNQVKFNLNFKPLSVNINNQEVVSQVTEGQQNITVGKSDVDVNIPVSQIINDKTFVVIISNENYQKEVHVKYALNDGKSFKEYCQKVLGIPEKNIHLALDASFGNMKSEIKWISDVAKAYNGEAKIIFYYSGHGMPNEQTKSAYLLPVDGFSSDFETAIKLDDLYARLNENPSKSVTVFLDACFSGSQRDNGMLAEARGVKIKPKSDIINGNCIVFSAASGDETAYPYKEKQHGLFTYYLLKKLQDTKGELSYQELFDYLKINVNQQSIVVNQKSQTPQVNAGINVQASWSGMKLK